MMVPTEARCVLHPTARSSGTCDRCGAFVCGSCETLHEGKRYCPACAKKMVQPLIRGSDQAYAAVVLSVLGLHCMFPLGVIGLILAYVEQQRIDRGEAPRPAAAWCARRRSAASSARCSACSASPGWRRSSRSPGDV